MFIRESRLVGVGIDDVDPYLTSTTVGLGGPDGVAYTAVHEPSRTTFVKSLIPGSVQLAGVGQGGVELLTVLHSLLIGKTVVVAGEEDLT